MGVVIAEIPTSVILSSRVLLNELVSHDGKSVVGVMPDSKVTFPDNLMTGVNKLRQIVFKPCNDGGLSEYK